jgi:hypothetical protein
MTKTDKILRDLIQATYTLTRGNWDIYIAFYEKGFDLLGEHGVLSFITPDKWISKPFGDTMRIKTTGNIHSILNAGRNVFESANVDAIVTIYTKTLQNSLMLFDFVRSEITPKRIIDKGALKPPYAYDWLFSNFIELLAKIEVQDDKLSNYGVCENACATSDAYKLQDFIHESSEKFPSNKYLRIINTGTIGKYISKWGQREMVYLGNRYTRPVVKKEQFENAFCNSYSKKAVKPKIIVKGLNLLDACLDSDGTIIPGKTTLLIVSESLDKLKLLLSIVNSPVAFFYLKEKYPASSYNQGTTFTKEMINDLPIPSIRRDDQQKIGSIVERILVEKTGNPNADITSWEQKINRILYDLYDLTVEEIKIIEGKNKS